MIDKWLVRITFIVIAKWWNGFIAFHTSEGSSSFFEGQEDTIKYSKLYFEILAILKIMKFWPDYSPGFQKSERPDWINMSDSIGFEVTRAISKHEGYTNFFAEKYFGKRKEEIPRQKLENFQGKPYFYEGVFRAISPSKGLTDSSSFYINAKNSYCKKLEALQTFKQTQINWLYLFCTFAMNEAELISLVEFFSQKEEGVNRYFNTIFLDTSDMLHIIDTDMNTIDSKVTKQDQILLTQAKELAVLCEGQQKTWQFEHEYNLYMKI